MFTLTSKWTSNVHITGTLCWESTRMVDSPHKGPVIQKVIPCHIVIVLWSYLAVTNAKKTHFIYNFIFIKFWPEIVWYNFQQLIQCSHVNYLQTNCGYWLREIVSITFRQRLAWEMKVVLFSLTKRWFIINKINIEGICNGQHISFAARYFLTTTN